MKITLGQFEPMLGDTSKNLETMTTIMEQAVEDDSDLVLFPELALTGYFIQDFADDLAETIDGPSIRHMQDVCKRLGVHTVLAYAERGDDGHVYNAACLISDEGELIGNYRKVHLYDREKEIFKPGHSFDVFDTKFGRIGMMICFDLDFPESARILTLKDAEIVLIPTNNFYPYERYQETYMKSRAMENEVPVAICNRTGQEQDLAYFGESAVYDHLGHQLLVLGDQNDAKTVEVSLTNKADDNLSYQQNRIPRSYSTLQAEDE